MVPFASTYERMCQLREYEIKTAGRVDNGTIEECQNCVNKRSDFEKLGQSRIQKRITIATLYNGLREIFKELKFYFQLIIIQAKTLNN